MEISVLYAVRTHSSGMEVLSANILPSSGLLKLVAYETAIISVPYVSLWTRMLQLIGLKLALGPAILFCSILCKSNRNYMKV